MLKRIVKYVVAAVSTELIVYAGGQAAEIFFDVSSFAVWLPAAVVGVAGLVIAFFWWRRDERLRRLATCYEALCTYSGFSRASGITIAEVEQSNIVILHMRTFCQILDDYDIPHPDLDRDISIVFENIGKWSSFMSRIVACGTSVRKMRKVAKAFMETNGAKS